MSRLMIIFLIFCSIFFFADTGRAGEFKVNFIYSGAGLRDPLIPSEFGQPAAIPVNDDSDAILSSKNLKIEGIMWDPVDPYVIINDEILRAGDELEGITIIKIEKESVTFGHKEKTIVIPLIGKGE